MAVDPLHRIGCGERQRAREHLIERDAERIEIAAQIDRAVHPSGLLGRHIGQRACDGLRRLEPLSFAREPRGDAEAGQPHPPVGAVHQNMTRFQVLVDEAALVGLAQRPCDPDREAQEAPQLHRPAEQARKRLSAIVLEQQHGPPALADELQRPRRPGAIQLVPHFIVMGEAVEVGRRRAVRRRPHCSAQRAIRRRRSGAIPGKRPDHHPPTRPGGSHPLSLNREEALISRTPPSRWRPPSIERRPWRRVRLPPPAATCARRQDYADLRHPATIGKPTPLYSRFRSLSAACASVAPRRART